MRPLKTSLIVPAYNEAEALPLVVKEYYPLVDEIIIVDDGSRDQTYAIAQTLADEKVREFKHAENSGKVAALRTGLSRATGDIIVFTDADCTYPARYLPDFTNAIEGGADLVLGSREINRENIPFFNRIGNTVFSLLAGYLSCQRIRDSQTGYRAFRREMFERLDVDAKNLEFETKMTVRAAKRGYRVTEIPIEYRKRVGTSKLRPIHDGVKMFQALISIAWHESTIIGKVIMIPSLLFLLMGLGFGAMSIYERFTAYNLIHAYYPLIAVFLILFGIQLISIGFIVDYLINKLDRIEERMRG